MLIGNFVLLKVCVDSSKSGFCDFDVLIVGFGFNIDFIGK